jgi:DNA-binding CsgD family transcriptional regulator
MIRSLTRLEARSPISDFSLRAHTKDKASARSVGDYARGEIRDVIAGPRLAQEDRPTTAVLVPLLDVQEAYRVWVTAFLLGAIARDTLIDPYAAHARRLEALTHGETRVLHYLPTNLSAREIADELFLSVNTVKTHQRHLYQKLGARSRTQAVEQARALGLLAPTPRRRSANRRCSHDSGLGNALDEEKVAPG